MQVVLYQLDIHEVYLYTLTEIQWRSWSTLDLSLMLISAMQHSPNPAAQFSLVFHYFDGNSPLLSFLRFHEEFVLRNDYQESKKHLQDFRLRMDKVRTCVGTSERYVGTIGNIVWIGTIGDIGDWYHW